MMIKGEKALLENLVWLAAGWLVQTVSRSGHEGFSPSLTQRICTIVTWASIASLVCNRDTHAHTHYRHFVTGIVDIKWSSRWRGWRTILTAYPTVGSGYARSCSTLQCAITTVFRFIFGAMSTRDVPVLNKWRIQCKKMFVALCSAVPRVWKWYATGKMWIKCNPDLFL